ncbi:hypothetical protein [Pseudomonas protegens]|uniref:hypothetical protein n=1 Tax=Pseudomonas protegens TaxID=380021 RepID=UPI0011CE2646|nr:hypothetical protein [Pseudomonas protegens]
MKSVVYEFPHPVLFIFDFTSDNLDIPEIDDSGACSSTATCIAVKVNCDTDGSVEVHLKKKLPRLISSTKIKIFDGAINTPNGNISVVTSELIKVTEISSEKKITSLKIFLDNITHPEKVWIEAH